MRRLVRWFNNVSIAQKLYFVLGTMGMLILVELTTLYYTVTTLSAVRAIVGGEGLWSKAQKDAIFYLELYGETLDERNYQKYQSFLTVSLGDRKTRLQLSSGPNFNRDVARQGFLEGRNNPKDVDRMIDFFLRFHGISYVSESA